RTASQNGDSQKQSEMAHYFFLSVSRFFQLHLYVGEHDTPVCEYCHVSGITLALPCHTDRHIPSALPIEVFGHMVYSWVCKHPDLCARSRRTSGLPWRPGSGPRPPVRSVVVRYSSPVPRASPPPRLHATFAAPIRPYATPFMPSTSAVLLCCSPSRHDRTPQRPSSTLGPASLSGRCCTRVRGRSASPRAGGRSRWPSRAVSPRASRRAWSATKSF